MARLGEAPRKQRQVQHTRKLGRELTGTISGSHHGAVRRGELRRFACASRSPGANAAQPSPHAGGAGDPQPAGRNPPAGSAPTAAASARKNDPRCQRRIKTNVQVHQARIGSADCLRQYDRSQRIQARRKSLCLLITCSGRRLNRLQHEQRMEETRLAGRLIHAATAQTLGGSQRSVPPEAHRRVRLHDSGHVLRPEPRCTPDPPADGRLRNTQGE